MNDNTCLAMCWRCS